MTSENCDYIERQKDLNKNGKRLYGKKMLQSHVPYNIWNEETDTFDLDKILKIYECFKYNMILLSEDFIPHWIEPEGLLYTTKSLIWDWTDESELNKTADSIEKYGLYFPIFVLPKGMLHNQICDLEEEARLKNLNIYNSYNGNHRIDAIQFLKENNRFNKKILVYEIPPYCQKSCTGFKYTFIDHNEPNELTDYKLKTGVRLYHLSYLEDEMKMSNLEFCKNIEDGIVQVRVDNYNTAFRILTEMQNALEAPLTRYFELYNKLPDGLDNSFFNNYEIWKKEVVKYDW